MKKRTGSASLGCLLCCICSVVLCFSCSSPFHSQSSSGSVAKGLKLSFLIQGTSASTSAKGAKLLLPTVKTLVVSLTPADSWLSTPSPQTVTVGSATTVVSASFTAVQYGNYTIAAKAFDSNGNLAFRQSSPLTFSATSASVTLNLVPVDVNTTDLQLTTAQSYTGTLDAGTSKTWAIPAGTSISSNYGVRITADSAIMFFAQDSTGAMINTDTSARTITASQAAGSFLTLYNSGTANLPIKFVLSAVNMVYDGNGATSGNAPTDLTAYAQGDTVSVVGNVGALAKSGYTFNGWNTASDGSGTAYAPGANFVMGSGTVTLYAQWTSTSITISFALGTYQSLSFSQTALTCYTGQSIAISPTFSEGTGWQWVVNGAVDAEQTTSQYLFTPTMPGRYAIYVTVTENGVGYSGSLSVTVANWPAIYVAGCGTNTLWVNGTGSLFNLNGIYGARSVFVSNGDIYVAGLIVPSNCKILYVKNGTYQCWDKYGSSSWPSSIVVKGSAVYIAGIQWDGNPGYKRALYVTADATVPASSATLTTHLLASQYAAAPNVGSPLAANSIFIVDSSHVYIAGTDSSGAACYWLSDGTEDESTPKAVETALTTGTADSANSIVVSGGHLYIAGTAAGAACCWVDGTQNSLTGGTAANSITVANGHVYVAGTDGTNALCWIDGVKSILPSGTNATSITVTSNGTVFIAGTNNGTTAQYWVNGETPVVLTGGTSANSIFVAQ
jgi:uncharacterized repeat protein (TIGR02543 family)